MRSERYLTSARGARYPDLIIGVSGFPLADHARGQFPAADNGVRMYVVARKFKERDSSGTGLYEHVLTSEKFAYELEDAASRYSNIWIAAWNAVSVFAAIGGWDFLESHHWNLKGSARNEKPRRTDMPEVREGEVNDPGVENGRDGETGLRRVRETCGHNRTVLDAKWGKSGRVDASSSCVIENPPTIISFKVYGCKASITLVDCENYGVPEPQPEISQQGRARIANGVLYTLCEFLSANSLGTLKTTAASQAWFSFKRRFMHYSLLAHNHQSALNLEDRAYVGGRAECFRLGKIPGRVTCLDFKSAYLSLYAGATLPTRLRHYASCKDNHIRVSHLECDSMIATVLLKTDSGDYPLRRDNDVIYPTGTFSTTLCGPELYHALSLGRVLRVYEYAQYVMQPALARYGQFMREIITECNGDSSIAQTHWAKRLAVAIVGKLAQRSKRWVPDDTVPYHKPFGYWHSEGSCPEPQRWRSIAWQVEREVTNQWAPEAVPAMAAWITSLCRRRLLDTIAIAGKENVYYLDTDCLFVNDVGLSGLECSGNVCSDSIGHLRILHQSNNCHIGGIKYYTFQRGKLPGRLYRHGSVRFDGMVDSFHIVQGDTDE